MRFLPLFCLVLITVFIVSCKTPQKTNYYYLENATDTSGKNPVKVFEPVIQKNDLLNIQIYSAATTPEADALYNLTNPNSSSSGNTGSALNGFLVDQRGNIEYPRLGTIHAEGLTKQQLAEVIKLKLTVPDTLLINPTVIVRFLNFRITVLGEVGSAGTISIPYERVNILEAIGLAGGIPLTGKKDAVRIIREVDGNWEVGMIDLTDKNVFASPYFYLKQNDFVIVDPTKAKLKTNDQSIITQRITFALTLITSAAFIYNIFK